MILGFSTKWDKRMGDLAGKYNFFPEKIISGLDIPDYEKVTLNDLLLERQSPKSHEFLAGLLDPLSDHHPKIHTLRHDIHNRWQPGRDIHFTINNRTKNSFRFAPVVKCTAVQYLDIARDGEIIQVYISSKEDRSDRATFYYQDWKVTLSKTKMLELAQNDGFDSIGHFFRYFNESCQLKLIHWTDKRY